MMIKTKKKRSKGIEAVRNRYGYTFVGHWIIGLIMFFLVPVVSSVIYSFNKITIGETGFVLQYIGLANFKEALFENPEYLDNVRDSVGSMFYSLPIVVALSLILAVLLNSKFPGRTAFRVVFFLPVIIASSVIVRLFGSYVIGSSIFDFTTDGTGIMDYQTILGNLNLPTQVTSILTFFLSNSVSLAWNCGVQTILFLAGLQGIPDSLYEVSKIEGANKWEEFWKITVPMVRHVLSLVIIYTMISLFTASSNAVMTSAITMMQGRDYGVASAVLWFYFIIVLAVIGLVLFLYNKLCVKKWE